MDIDIAGQLLPAFAGVGVALLAFAVILWLIKNRKSRFFALPGLPGGDSSRRRLAVVETATLDVRRRLILVRRDNMEHLIMVGGPADIVIESREIGQRAAQLPNQQMPAAPPRPAPAPAYHQQQPQPRAPQPQPQPTAPQSQMRNPAVYDDSDDDYAYGPEATALGRHYDLDEPQQDAPEYHYQPQQPASQPMPRAQAEAQPTADQHQQQVEAHAARLKRETAESILEAARQRIMGGQAQGGQTGGGQTGQQTSQARQSRAPTTAANMQETAFTRVLDGRARPGDIPAAQTPQVRPERSWSPPPLNTRPAAATAAQRKVEPDYSEEELEEKVRIILGELQRRNQ